MIRIYCTLFLLVLYRPGVAQQSKNADTSRIYKAVDIFLVPKDGMNNLKISWLNYLQEALRNGRLDKVIHADHIFEVLVTKDGVLLDRSNGAKDLVLFDFLSIQKRWRPGIQSGRPISSLLKLKVPKALFDTEKVAGLLLQEDLVWQEQLK